MTSDELFRHVRKSSVPNGGWTEENFRGEARRKLMRDFVNIQRNAKAEGIRIVSGQLDTMFRDQIERVASAGERISARLFTPLQTVGIGSHELLWEQAIEQELRSADAELSLILVTPFKNVGEIVNRQTLALLGIDGQSKAFLERIEEKASFGESLKERLRQIAGMVKNINETTRNRIRNTVLRAISEGSTVFDVAEQLRNKLPALGTSRIATIARTEMGRAADEGTKTAMRDSDVVTHFSVIGCEKVEANGPHWNGEPTCNIQDVPIQFEYEIEFHRNHTGAIVASGFRRADGSVQDRPTRGGEYSETE